MRETAILRAAHVQSPQHRQWDETVLPTLPSCYTPLTLSPEHEEEKEEKEIALEEENEQQQRRQPSSQPLTISTPLKPTEEEDPDGTFVTPRRLPFDPATQTAPSVLRSSMLKAAALAAS